MKSQSSFSRNSNRFFTDPTAAKKTSLTVISLVSIAVFFLLLHGVEASNKFWIAASPGNFNNDANWSLSSGGPPNTTAPGAGDVAFFDGNGLGSCTIAANAIAQAGSTDEEHGAGIAFATNAMETIVSDAVEMERLMGEAEGQLGRTIAAEDLPDIDDTPVKKPH